MLVLNNNELFDVKYMVSILLDLFELLKSKIILNISTIYIDNYIRDYIKNISNTIYSAPKYVYDFPGFCCISINNCVCHGIPGNYILQNNDIVKVDISVKYNNIFADMCRTYVVGICNEEVQSFINNTRFSLLQFVKIFNETNYYKFFDTKHIGQFFYDFAINNNYGVIHEYGGHGIGRDLHSYPIFINAPMNTYKNYKIYDGLLFCLEPMFVFGCTPGLINTKTIGFEVYVDNRYIASHFEDMFIFKNNKIYNIIDFIL